ncbi:MAG: starch-binding protein [Ruminococcaceae bacterium]|nr:starch-binding protein [Oscillospiraceae bacterium]
MKKFISLLMVLCMLMTIAPLTFAADTDATSPDPASYPSFATSDWEALYAHAIAGDDSTEAWQKWMKDYQGFNAEEGIRYFFLPATSHDSIIEIYNNYNEDAVVGDVTIPAHTSAFVEYVEDEEISVIVGADKTYQFKVLKSDAEASLYINDATNSYVDVNDETQNTDLWSFLVQNKENSCSTASYSIVDKNGVQDGDLKKIKGRGNTNWRDYDKKPFNINFSNTTTIGNTTSKKFSLVSNTKDSTLLRNSIMYDLSKDVGSPYYSDQSFIDFFVNGVYRGSYIACQKVDLGKNTMIPLKDESEDVETGFNFLVEVDVWNYKNDTYFTSKKGFNVVLKTPDLEDFETNSPQWQVRYDYIKNKYQELENALYNGTLADIEKICDMESLAQQYLLQDFGKNCDGGYTSTFFTYNAEENKFYATPIWDCDSDLGAVDVRRDGCQTSTGDHTGWTTRTATYNRVVNPYGQAFYVKGTTSQGETFEQLCARIWNTNFVPKIDILLGKAQPGEGDLVKSIEAYASSIEKSTYINYIMWDFAWLCQDHNRSLKMTFTDDVEGELEYLYAWVKARSEWMTDYFNNIGDEPVNPPVDSNTKTVYFSTELDWDDVHYYVWGNSIPMQWPGEKAQYLCTNEYGNDVYKIVIDLPNVSRINFNNGANGAQTASTDIIDGMLYYTTDPSGKINGAGMPYYNTETMTFTEPVEPTTIPATSADEITTTVTQVPTETTTTPTTEETTTPEPVIPTLPHNTITAFCFDPTGKTAGEKLEEYGTKDGYAATFGEGTLVGSVNDTGYRALEWSEPEYGKNESMVPIMAAGGKNPWGDNPYVQVTLSTKGFEDLAISLESAGSKKCPASWQLSYSLDGENFTDIEGASYTIALADRKTPIFYFDNLTLPEAVADKETVVLRLYATTDVTISGGVVADDPTGGELVLNNIIITGNATQSAEGIIGDCDLDGKVTIKDATLIQKHLAKLTEISEKGKPFADVNKDTEISISDATAIQKFVAGLLDKF